MAGTPVVLQPFDEQHPLNVDQLNHVLSTLIASINSLAGEQVIQWGTGAPTSAIYMPIAGGDFTGPVTAPALSVGDPTPSPVMTRAGGTFTGPVTLAADAAQPLQPASKQQLDGKVSKTGDTINPILAIDAPQAAFSVLDMRADGVSRWAVNRGPDNALGISRRDGVGHHLDTPLSLNHGNGDVNIQKAVVTHLVVTLLQIVGGTLNVTTIGADVLNLSGRNFVKNDLYRRGGNSVGEGGLLLANCASPLAENTLYNGSLFTNAAGVAFPIINLYKTLGRSREAVNGLYTVLLERMG